MSKVPRSKKPFLMDSLGSAQKGGGRAGEPALCSGRPLTSGGDPKRRGQSPTSEGATRILRLASALPQ